jgi:hypothetical protein
MRTTTIVKRIERLEQDYSLEGGSSRADNQGIVTWEDYLLIFAVEKKCQELGDSDAKLLRRACKLATNWEGWQGWPS